MSEFVQIEIQLSRSSTVTCAPDGPLYCGVLAPGNHPHMDVGRVRPVT